MLPIASEMPSAAYWPLVLLLVGYVVLGLMSNRARAHDDRAQADRWGTIGFGLVLLAAVYVVILAIASVVGYAGRVYDMVIILFVFSAFFAILLFVFFLLAEVIPRAFRRGGGER